MRCLLAFVLLASMTAEAQSIEEDERPIFVYGESCDQLAVLSYREIRSVTHQSYQKYFNRFCMVDNVYTCEDYSALLEGAGTLLDTGAGYCRLEPAQY